ncbi:putative oxidoreductase, partial [Salmonella enterica subsp. enterica serovar Heidelberg str. N18440]
IRDKLITHTFDYQHVTDAIELFEKDQRQCCKGLTHVCEII